MQHPFLQQAKLRHFVCDNCGESFQSYQDTPDCLCGARSGTVRETVKEMPTAGAPITFVNAA